MKPTSPEEGYTLLEMLVVLSIVGLLGIAFNSALGHQRSALNTRDVSRQIAALARSTLAKAIVSGRQAALHVDTGNRTISSESSPTRIQLPTSLEMSMRTAEQLVEGDRMGSIVFFPNGSSSGGEISLRAAKARTYTVRVFWLTGEVSTLAAQDD